MFGKPSTLSKCFLSFFKVINQIIWKAANTSVLMDDTQFICLAYNSQVHYFEISVICIL